MTSEKWKAVVGYEGFYEASDLGRIRSIDRLIHYKGRPDHPALKKGKILSCPPHHSGYRHLALCKNGKQKMANVCTLVAKAFVHNPDPVRFTDVNHMDLDKTNDRADNLEWTTHRGNIDHSVRQHRYAKKLTPQIVSEIRTRASNGESQASISRSLSLRYLTVHLVVNRKTWGHI